MFGTENASLLAPAFRVDSSLADKEYLTPYEYEDAYPYSIIGPDVIQWIQYLFKACFPEMRLQESFSSLSLCYRGVFPN